MSTRRNTPLRGLAAALVVSCITAAAPAAAQTAQVRYAAQTEYTYSADLTFTQRQSVASTSSTSPASATSTQALRLQGTFQISPVSVDVVSGTTVLRLTIPGQFQVFQGDGSGTWTPLSADAGGLQGDYLLEQAANGQVLSVGFQPLAGTTDARTLMARNTIKGLAGLLDFRLAASGSPLAALCTDVMGQYNATFTRTSPTQIQVVKSSYASLAPGLGLYRLDGGTPTPVVEGTLAASGQSLITLDASNTLVARSIDHETVQLVPTEGAYPDPANSLTQVQDGGSFTASNSLWATMSGDVTLVSKVSATSTTWVASAFSDKQSLQGVVLPAQAMPSTPATLARAEARVKEGLLKIQDPATQFQGEMLVARGLRQGASLQAVRDQILDPRADLRVARGLAQALGGCRHAEVRELVRQGLVHPRLHEGVKGALLQALMGAPTVEPELVDAVEKAAGGTGWSAKVASHTLATLVPAIGKDDPARAKRVVADLAAQLEGAKGDGERADLLTRLSATRSIHAAQSLQAYAQDAASPLGRIATRGLQDIAGHVAPVGAPVVATQDAAQQSIYLPVLTPDHFCDLLSTYSIADFTSSKKACSGLVSRSAGSDLIGGMVWVGGGVGVNYPAKKGALGVAGGFRLNLLGMKIPFMDGEGVALYDSATPANGGIFWDYHILGIPGAFQVLPWQDTPDDPNNPYYTHDYPVQFFDMDSGPIPVGPFFADFQAGAGLESGVDFKSELSQPQDMYAVLAPWSGISAYAEASIGWFCVDLALELKGQFLKTSIPIRADMDMRSLMHEDGAPGFSWCLTEDLQVVPWSLQLIGRFDYCIGSASKVLWSDSGRPEVWNLSNNCDPKADLVVKDLIWSPNDDPDASKPMVFTATLANLTNARTNPARPLVAAIQVDGTTVGTFTVKDAAGQPRPLAGGEVYAGQILWNPTAGTHTVTAVVNAVASSSQVSESDYSNDALSKTLTVKPVLPDLVVSGVQVTPGAGGATLAVNLANMGPGPDPVNWVTRPGPRNMDGSTRTITVAVPAPVPFQVTANGVVVYQGSTLLSKAASVPVPVTAGGQPVQSVSVTVNPAGAIQERSAQNNTMANINVAQTDQQVPVVVLSGPTLQDRVAEAWQWTAAITEDVRLDRVDWFLDGSLLVRNRTITSPGSQSLSLPVYVAGLSEGAHTLQVTAYDQAGHVGTSALASFTVRHPDLTPPRVSLGAVTDLNGFFTVSATAVDDRDGVDHVDFYMDKVKVATAAAAPYTVQIPNTASVIFGSHFMHAVAYDKAGLEPGGVANRAESPAVLFEKSTVLVEQEPNDDMVHANPLYDYSDGIQGSASLNGDSDWFKVPCTPGTSLTINGGMHTSIYDAAGVLRADSLLGADDGSTLPAAFISWKNTSATPYVYVSVKGRNILRRNPVTIDDPTPTYTLTYAGGPYRLTLRKQ